MTILAYRDGVLAADSGSFNNGVKRAYTAKVARASDGTLYGVCGNAAEAEAYLDWVRVGAEGDPPVIRRTKPEDSVDAMHVLRVRLGRDPERVTGYGVETWVGSPYAAIGSAAEVALGALHAGANAKEAVEAAIEHSQWAHGPVQSVTHKGFHP